MRHTYTRRNNLNGLFTCKRGCDLKYPFNKEKRQACKAECEAKNVEEATSEYGSFFPTATTTTTESGTSAPPPTMAGMDNQKLLTYGAIGIGAVLIISLFTAKDAKKPKKRR